MKKYIIVNVVEDLLEDRIDRAYVERRVEDWKSRIAELYARSKAWLPAEWTASKSGDAPMREELMQRFVIPEQRLPVFRLEAEDGRRARFEPRGLWIIGANGRVDLILPAGQYLIGNREDSFDPPNWQIASIAARSEQRVFDEQSFRNVLA